MGKSHALSTYASLSPLVFGAVLCGLGHGEADFDAAGVVLMCVATVASAVKMVAIHSVIRKVRSPVVVARPLPFFVRPKAPTAICRVQRPRDALNAGCR